MSARVDDDGGPASAPDLPVCVACRTTIDAGGEADSSGDWLCARCRPDFERCRRHGMWAAPGDPDRCGPAVAQDADRPASGAPVCPVPNDSL